MADENGGAPRGYLLFLSSPTGYTLKELEGEPPTVGAEVAEGVVVTKVGLSPYPRDSRVCVYAMGKR